MKIRKVLGVLLTFVLCLGTMRVTSNADVIGVNTKISSGGSGGNTELKLYAERTYLTPAISGYFGYDYTTTACYSYKLNKADKWIIRGSFNWPTESKVIRDTRYNSNGVYVSTSLRNDESQFISGNFTATAQSTAFGDTTLTLNVVY
ncbi:MAG: hypothetical protein ACI4EN_08230 [Butyrivibrio sp.]